MALLQYNLYKGQILLTKGQKPYSPVKLLQGQIVASVIFMASLVDFQGGRQLWKVIAKEMRSQRSRADSMSHLVSDDQNWTLFDKMSSYNSNLQKAGFQNFDLF